MKKIAIIGAGPCGLMTAITLKKKHPNYQVLLLEKENSIGKRIKVSGNGRCNFSNTNISKYFFHNGDLIEDIITSFKNVSNDIYDDLHLHYYADNEGRIYPRTNASITVLKAFEKKLKELDIDLHLQTEFISYQEENGQFLIKTNNGNFLVNNIVFASGGASYLYQDKIHSYLKSNNILITPLNSSLCPIVVQEKIPHNVVGKRAKVAVKLLKNNQVCYEEDGELLFKKDGISGIVIFNVSSYLSRNNAKEGEYTFEIDFANDIDTVTINNELKKYTKFDILSSYVVEEIASWIDSLYSNINEGLHSFKLTFKKLYSLKESQVTCGGVSLSEVNMSKLNLKKNPRIYIGGELLDIDGICGGYNIFLAMACGYTIGKSID